MHTHLAAHLAQFLLGSLSFSPNIFTAGSEFGEVLLARADRFHMPAHGVLVGAELGNGGGHLAHDQRALAEDIIEIVTLFSTIRAQAIGDTLVVGGQAL